MNIVIPMAGAGQRFLDAGYKIHKPAIMTTDYRTGKKYPMVVCATMDLPGVEEGGRNVYYIDRVFHRDSGVQKSILKNYPQAKFITIEKLTEGQACTCLMAKKMINTEDALLIAGCDNGMIFDKEKFHKMEEESDVLVFTYRHNAAVEDNPNAYGWIKTDNSGNVTDISIKKALSNNPMEDQAIVATFWFKHGSIFVEAAEKMIKENDRINGEFYVDEVLKHTLELGYITKAFEIGRYIGWGTPHDYECYMKSFEYWSKFVETEDLLGEHT